MVGGNLVKLKADLRKTNAISIKLGNEFFEELNFLCVSMAL